MAYSSSSSSSSSSSCFALMRLPPVIREQAIFETFLSSQELHLMQGVNQSFKLSIPPLLDKIAVRDLCRLLPLPYKHAAQASKADQDFYRPWDRQRAQRIVSEAPSLSCFQDICCSGLRELHKLSQRGSVFFIHNFDGIWTRKYHHLNQRKFVPAVLVLVNDQSHLARHTASGEDLDYDDAETRDAITRRVCAYVVDSRRIHSIDESEGYANCRPIEHWTGKPVRSSFNRINFICDIIQGIAAGKPLVPSLHITEPSVQEERNCQGRPSRRVKRLIRSLFCVKTPSSVAIISLRNPHHAIKFP